MGKEEFARLARALGFRGKRKPKPAPAAPAHHTPAHHTPAHSFGATMHAANVAAVGQRHHSKAEAEALSAKAWDKGWDSAHEAAAGAWRHVAERAPTAAEYNAAVASLKAHWRHLDRLHPSAHKLPTRPKAAKPKAAKPKAAKPKAAKKVSGVTLVTLSLDAARNMEETSTDVAADVARLRSGEITRDALLAECLDGADEDRVEGWREYVEAVSAAAGPLSAKKAGKPRKRKAAK